MRSLPRIPPGVVLACTGIAVQIGLPACLVWAALEPGFAPASSLSGAASLPWVAGALLPLAWFLVVLPWAQVASYYLRWGFVAVAVAGTALRAGWALAGFAAAVLLAGMWALRAFLNGGTKPPALVIAPPLGPGWYFVGQGGNSGALNHHFRSPSQRYALDLLQLNRWGFRARGFFPAALGRYRIYGAAVLCPHDGVVTAVVEGLPEVEPVAQRDRLHIAGNHIVIECAAPQIGAKVYLGLAHLLPGSIRVRAGERVAAGQALARVGNSGNSSEPHLHIHAKRGGRPDTMLDGEGVPLSLHGRFLARNDVFRGAPVRAEP